MHEKDNVERYIVQVSEFPSTTDDYVCNTGSLEAQVWL